MKKLEVEITARLALYLDDLVKQGLHGSTRDEVAERLVSLAVARLIAYGVLQVRR